MFDGKKNNLDNNQHDIEQNNSPSILNPPLVRQQSNANDYQVPNDGLGVYDDYQIPNDGMDNYDNISLNQSKYHSNTIDTRQNLNGSLYEFTNLNAK